MESLEIISIVLIILTILPYIAIVGTWTETTKIKKTLDNIDDNLVKAINTNIKQQAEMINLLKGNNQMITKNKINSNSNSEPKMDEIHL